MTAYAVTGNLDLTTKARYLRSWAFAENAGTPAAARVILKDGSSTGPNIVDIRLDLSASKSDSLPQPIFFPNGIYVHVTTGTARGSIDAI